MGRVIATIVVYGAALLVLELAMRLGRRRPS
jgi:hypothetical protein